MKLIVHIINGVSLLLFFATVAVSAFLLYFLMVFEFHTWPNYVGNENRIYDRVILGNDLDDWAYGFTVDFITPIGICLVLFLLLFATKSRKIKILLLFSIFVWFLVEIGIFTFFSDMNDFLE